MALAPFAFHHHLVAPGSRQRIPLTVGSFLTYEDLRLQVTVVHGKRPGPVLLLTAAIHGDEYNGTEIIRRILTHPKLSRLAGTLLAVPIVNRPGFITRSRYMPDRRDLNRLFPGSATGSLGARLARLLIDEVVSRADLVIDLHTGAINRPNLPHIRICPELPRDRELAELFGAPVLLVGQPHENSFRNTCRTLGKPYLLYEAGEALRLDPNAIRFGVQGVLSVMARLGMIAGSGSKRRSTSLLSTRSFWERAPAGGIFIPLVPLGRAVKKDTLLGFVADPHGGGENPVTASREGVIIGRTNEAVADEGDGLFHIASLANLAKAETHIARTTGALPTLKADEDDHPVPYDSLSDTV